jgi:hypothetical protein
MYGVIHLLAAENDQLAKICHRIKATQVTYVYLKVTSINGCVTIITICMLRTRHHLAALQKKYVKFG